MTFGHQSKNHKEWAALRIYGKLVGAFSRIVKHQCSWRFVSSSSNIASESDQSASVLYSGLICQGSGYLVSGSVHLLASNDRTGADTTLYGLIWPMHTILSISNTDHKPSKQLRYKSMIFGVQASFVHTFGSGNRDNITDKILMHIDHQCMSPVKTLDITL